MSEHKFNPADILDEMILECSSKNDGQILIALLIIKDKISDEYLKWLLPRVIDPNYQTYLKYDLGEALYSKYYKLIEVDKKLQKKLDQLPDQVYLKKDDFYSNSWLVISEEHFNKSIQERRADLAVASKDLLRPYYFSKVDKSLFVSIHRKVSYSIEEALAHLEVPGYIILMIEEYTRMFSEGSSTIPEDYVQASQKAITI